MARITVEDCLEHADNRYDLVLLAAKRARQIMAGADTLVEQDKDKATVVALREIAEGLVRSDNIDKLIQHDLDEVSDVEQADTIEPQ